MAFHPYPQVIPSVFNRSGFGPPRGLTPASACPWIAHPASRLRRATGTPVSDSLSLRLASKLNLAARRNSLAHSTKGTPSHPEGVLRLLVGARFQVLFHSPPGVLFTFPSRYWSTIGHRQYSALEGGPPSFEPRSTCAALLGNLYAPQVSVSPTGPSPPLRPAVPGRSATEPDVRLGVRAPR